MKKRSHYPTAREVLFVLALGLTIAGVSGIGSQWVVWAWYAWIAR